MKGGRTLAGSLALLGLTLGLTGCGAMDSTSLQGIAFPGMAYLRPLETRDGYAYFDFYVRVPGDQPIEKAGIEDEIMNDLDHWLALNQFNCGHKEIVRRQVLKRWVGPGLPGLTEPDTDVYYIVRVPVGSAEPRTSP